MLNDQFVRTYKRGARKSKTVPDQSMSISEIVRKFVRGIPVDVVQRQGVFVDQNEHDLEKLSRMDFAEKSELASEMREHTEQVVTDIEERKQRAKKVKEQKAKESEQSSAGIGSLDNTMPVDTKVTTK